MYCLVFYLHIQRLQLRNGFLLKKGLILRLPPTSRVSQPPTMLSPRPVRPLEISMVVSQPGMMGQVVGSQARVEGVDERLKPKTEEVKDIR